MTINTGNGSYTYAGVIGADTFPDSPTNNNLSLTKTGEGTQILAGGNAYTGATTVQQGTLAFAASQPKESQSSDQRLLQQCRFLTMPVCSPPKAQMSPCPDLLPRDFCAAASACPARGVAVTPAPASFAPPR